MSYINQIQIGQGQYKLYGLDTMVKVPYTKFNINGTVDNTTETDLRNAIFGTDELLTSQILSGTVNSYNTSQAYPGNLVTYIQNVHNYSFRSQQINTPSLTVTEQLVSEKSANLNELSYQKIINSPIDIEWQSDYNMGQITLWEEANKSSLDTIQWKQTANGLAISLPQKFSITSHTLEWEDGVSFVTGSLAEASSGRQLTIKPSLISKMPVNLGTRDYSFKSLYCQKIYGNSLAFKTTTEDSSITIAATYKASAGDCDKISTRFNVERIDAANQAQAEEQTISWILAQQTPRQESGHIASYNALSMRVPNFFSIAADGNGNGEEKSVVFQSIGNDNHGYQTSIYPEGSGGNLGMPNHRWSKGYFTDLDAGGIEASGQVKAGSFNTTGDVSSTGIVTCGKIDATGYGQNSQSKFWDLDAHSIAVGDNYSAQDLENGDIQATNIFLRGVHCHSGITAKYGGLYFDSYVAGIDELQGETRLWVEKHTLENGTEQYALKIQFPSGNPVTIKGVVI